jgi:hypothetical protein
VPKPLKKGKDQQKVMNPPPKKPEEVKKKPEEAKKKPEEAEKRPEQSVKKEVPKATQLLKSQIPTLRVEKSMAKITVSRVAPTPRPSIKP